MRMARSTSPRWRNRLPSAKCVSTVSESTCATRMKTSSAWSGCSFNRKFRPRKYSVLTKRNRAVCRLRSVQCMRMAPSTTTAIASRMTRAAVLVVILLGQIAQIADFHFGIAHRAFQPPSLALEAENDRQAAGQVINGHARAVGVGQQQREREDAQQDNDGDPTQHDCQLRSHRGMVIPGHPCQPARLSLTRSRKSLPGLKCGTCLPGRAT